jgi:predicted dienelactone hydrolase
MQRSHGLGLVVVGSGLLLALCGCGPDPTPVAIDRAAFFAPDAPGPYRVHRRSLDDGRGTLYVPSSNEATADRSLFPRPLVVFVPGFSASEEAYRKTLEHLASHGYAMLGAQHDFNFLTATLCRTQRDGRQRVGETIALVRQLARDDPELRGLLDDDRFAMIGHSYGGKVALWIAADNGDVAIVFALDPVDGGDDRRPGWCGEMTDAAFPRLVEQLQWHAMPPIAMVGAGKAGECAPAAGNSVALYGALRSDVLHLRLPGAGHQDFVDAAADDNCLGCDLCPAGDEAAADVQRFARGSLVAFLKARWQGDMRFASWLSASGDPTLLRAPPQVEVERK